MGAHPPRRIPAHRAGHDCRQLQPTSAANDNASGAWVTVLRILDGEHPPRRDWRRRLQRALY
jgi:hypothetical protein